MTFSWAEIQALSVIKRLNKIPYLGLLQLSLFWGISGPIIHTIYNPTITIKQ